MAKFIDETGLAALWAKVKALITSTVTANKYTHPSYTAKASGLYKTTVDSTGHVSATTAVAKADITALGIPAQDTTYSVATQSANGLMPSTDKTKLDGVETGANNYVHPSSAGNVHIPAAGAAGNILTWGGTPGTAQWKAVPDVLNTSSFGSIVSGQAIATYVASAIATEANVTGNTYAKKADVVGMYKYKGSVSTATSLPTSGQTAGDVYNIESASAYGSAGMNVAWDGTKWDPLGEIFTITSMTNAEIDAICV